MQYTLHLNLKQKAALKIATSFWERKEIQDKIEKFFEPTGRMTTYHTRPDWQKLIKTILKEWNKDTIPRTLEIELNHIVKMIGERVYDWYRYINYEYEVISSPTYFIDKIFWTPHGTVDEIRIFKTFWLDDDFDPATVYSFACRYALEEHINSLWDKMPRDKQNYYYNKTYRHFEDHILAYWKCCKDGNLSNLIRFFEASVMNIQEFNLLYKLNRSPEENMLHSSVYQGYHFAVKYFWEKLTEEEKDHSIVKCARIAVMRYNYYEQEEQGIDHKKNQCVEICLFLINQMTENHKETFFNKKVRLNEPYSWRQIKIDAKNDFLKMLLFAWPWQELFIPVLKDILRYQDDNSKMSCMFLNVITQKMMEDHYLGYSLEMSRYRILLREAWLIIPKCIKQKLGQEDSRFAFIFNLIHIWDLESLKLILNDPAVAVIRDNLIENGKALYEQFIFNDQYEKLNQFIEEVFTSEKDRSSFKMMMDTWYFFIMDGQFDLADKLLDWQCSTPEERQSYKSNIKHIPICERMIKDSDYDLLEKFLDWKLETAKEKEKCKNHFKNDDFSIDQIHNIWEECGKNINKAKKKSSRLLRWLFESDEEIASFKKEKIISLDNFFLINCQLPTMHNHGILDDFLYWCLLNNEEVQRVKQAVLQ